MTDSKIESSLTLMTYHGVVLLLAGYQADEAHIVRQYQAIVDKSVQPDCPVNANSYLAGRARATPKALYGF